MKYISMFSGIEAATSAWHPLGWEPVAFAEIEPFPAAVLAHHWPDVPNLGDMTKVDWGAYRGKVDIVIGGPPCQAFSVAGLRKSLEDERGNLSLEYVKAIHAIRPRFAVTENVPGWLSTGDNAFGCFLAGMVGADAPLNSPLERGRWTDAGFASGPLGACAWRVINAQYFGVAQRRRRVFVVADFGERPDPCAVLFERKGGGGNPPKGRTAREGLAPSLAARTRGGGGLGTDAECDGALIPEVARVAGTLDAHYGDKFGLENQHVNAGCPNFIISKGADSDTKPGHLIPEIAHTLKGDGFDGSEDGTGRGTPIVPVAFAIQERAVCENLDAGPGGIGIRGDGVSYTLEARQVPQAVACRHLVRRLTPKECERLQGFPDNHTLIPWRGKPAELCPDGPRYKAIGNSMAVPVIRWIGERIARASER